MEWTIGISLEKTIKKTKKKTKSRLKKRSKRRGRKAVFPVCDVEMSGGPFSCAATLKEKNHAIPKLIDRASRASQRASQDPQRGTETADEKAMVAITGRGICTVRGVCTGRKKLAFKNTRNSSSYALSYGPEVSAIIARNCFVTSTIAESLCRKSPQFLFRKSL